MEENLRNFIKELESKDLLKNTVLLAELHDILNGKPVMETLHSCLKKAEQENIRFNSYISILEDFALEQAERIDRLFKDKAKLGNLVGIPISLKDIIYTNFSKTTMASSIFKNFIPDYNAELVNEIIINDAIIIGKNNLHEFASGVSGLSSYFGPVKNPIDDKRIAGGSSSGSAVSVAFGSALASIGTDTRGSIRIPASFCGIVGFKPTYNSISIEGVYPLAPTFDTVGILTKKVLDAAYIFKSLSYKELNLNYLIDDIKPQRINIGYINNEETEVEKSIAKFVDKITSEGFNVEKINLDIKSMSEYHRKMRLAEASQIHHKNFQERKSEYSKDVAKLIEDGFKISAVEYITAQNMRIKYKKEILKLFNKVDVLLTPTVYDIAPKIDDLNDVEKQLEFRSKATEYVSFASYLGAPALSLPVGYYNGMPYSIQLVGNIGDDDKLLKISYIIETTNSSRLNKF